MAIEPVGAPALICCWAVLPPHRRVSVSSESVPGIHYDEHSDYVLYQRSGETTTGQPAGDPEARWLDLYCPESMHRAETMPFSVAVQNSSKSSWVAGQSKGIFVSYHWLDKNGRPVIWEEKRTALPCDVPTVGSVLVSVLLQAPPGPGEHILQWGLVRLEDGWLSNLGVMTEPKRVSVR